MAWHDHRLTDETALRSVIPPSGNGRIDTFLNVVQRPSVGLVLLVPGILETCRISGRGSVTIDPELLDVMVIERMRPELALIIEIDEAFVHCGKAIRRSGLWSGEHAVARSDFPTMGQMLHDHAGTCVVAAWIEQPATGGDPDNGGDGSDFPDQGTRGTSPPGATMVVLPRDIQSSAPS